MLKKLIDRWRSDTPILYKRIRNVAASLSAMAVAAKTALDAVSIEVGPTWTKIIAYTIGIGAAIAAMSQLARKDDNANKDTTVD